MTATVFTRAKLKLFENPQQPKQSEIRAAIRQAGGDLDRIVAIAREAYDTGVHNGWTRCSAHFRQMENG